MALQTLCQTPGSSVAVTVNPKSRVIVASVQLPPNVKITDEEADLIERNIHNVLELVLAPYFRKPTH